MDYLCAWDILDAECPIPQNIENGAVESYSLRNVGYDVIFACDEGYAFEGPAIGETSVTATCVDLGLPSGWLGWSVWPGHCTGKQSHGECSLARIILQAIKVRIK